MKGVYSMHLKMKDILEFPSLKESQLLTGSKNLQLPVTDAIVMEALDIEAWGKKGQLLLTSYYAFEHATSQEVQSFFEKAKALGIVGFIFKTDRLVQEIPEDFISQCKKHSFPLIQISKQVTYPEVIREILSAIVSQSALLLNVYYENHQRFLQLMMQQADVKAILQTLDDLIQLPVTLIEKVDNTRISSGERHDSFKILRESSLNRQRTLQYKYLLVNYEKSTSESSVLSFPIPNLGYEEYELIVHKKNDDLTDMQLMAIENTVVALQTEFVQRYALRQNNNSRLNEMASELIFGRLSRQEDIEDTIYNLGLDASLPYRIIIFSFENQLKAEESSVFNRFTDKVINLLKSSFNDSIYITQSSKIILIVPIHAEDLRDIKALLRRIYNRLYTHPLYKSMPCKITISEEKSIYNLPNAYKQVMDMRPIIDFWQSESPIVAYEDLGISKLFIETENVEALKRFVPETIWTLQAKNPELLKTLYTFINANQNYSDTAKLLFVHPKTVRYRVNQLTEQYNIPFDQPDKILYYNIAIRITQFLHFKNDATL